MKAEFPGLAKREPVRDAVWLFVVDSAAEISRISLKEALASTNAGQLIS
jgi:hypothetical protein